MARRLLVMLIVAVMVASFVTMALQLPPDDAYVVGKPTSPARMRLDTQVPRVRPPLVAPTATLWIPPFPTPMVTPVPCSSNCRPTIY